jgi:Cu/Ag efflux protein CusF
MVRKSLLLGLLLAWVAPLHGAEPEWVAAEIRRIDLENARVTLRHEDIKSLDMPAMTMVFTVREPKLLAEVKVGDEVLVTVVREEGRFVVTEMKPAP